MLMFEPRAYRGGRVKVYGCSPGCLLVRMDQSQVLHLHLLGGVDFTMETNDV